MRNSISIFNNSLEDREKLYFSVLETATQYYREKLDLIELNSSDQIEFTYELSVQSGG